MQFFVYTGHPKMICVPSLLKVYKIATYNRISGALRGIGTVSSKPLKGKPLGLRLDVESPGE